MVAISDFAQGLFDYDADRDIALYGGLQGIVLADFLLGLEKNKSPKKITLRSPDMTYDDPSSRWTIRSHYGDSPYY